MRRSRTPRTTAPAPECRAPGGRPRREAGVLAWVVDDLPGRTLEDRLAWAGGHGVALEVALRDGFDPAPFLAPRGAAVVTVQAWGLHHAHPLHPDPETRARAPRIVAEALEVAARLGARRVVTVCGFGDTLADRPFERSLDFFAALCPHAARLGVSLLVEPLGRHRCAAMSRPDEVIDLLVALDRPDASGLVLDTGHLLDAGSDPEALLAGCPVPVRELHLKGPGSAPPGDELPIERWLAALREDPEVIAVEHRRPISPEAAERLLGRLRRALDP